MGEDTDQIVLGFDNASIQQPATRTSTVAAASDPQRLGIPPVWKGHVGMGWLKYPRSVSHFCSVPAPGEERIADGVSLMVRCPDFLRGKAACFAPLGSVFFLLLLTVCAVQLMGTACADDCLRQWSTSPVHAHDQLPGSPDGQTETDPGEGELEELALAQGEGFRIIHLARTCILDTTSCPRTDFASDWFRPPALR